MKISEKSITIVESTIPVVEQNIDKIVDVFYQLLLSENLELRNIFSKSNQDSGLQKSALGNSIIQYIKNLKQLNNLSSLIEVIANKHASLSIQPEQYAIVGKYLMQAIEKVLGKLDDEIVLAWKEIYEFLANVLIQAEEKLYQKSLNNNGWIGWKECVVYKKEQNSEEIKSFYLKPKDGSQIPKFKPGQYISVKVFIKELGFEQPRQYSLSEESNDQYLKISVKKELPFNDQNSEYMVSRYLHDHINEGDSILVTSPQGNFVLKEQHDQLVFMAGGIGITPILSMINSIKNKNIDVLFVYAYRNDDVAFNLEELKKIENENSSLQMILYSEKESRYANFLGFININDFKDKFKECADFYICGPEKFIMCQVESLMKLGIEKSKINYELFSPNLINLVS